MKKIISVVAAAVILLGAACVTVSAQESAAAVDGVVYSSDGTKLIECTSKYSAGSVFSVPEGVTEICDGAFMSNSGITTVILPSTLQKIGYDAFRNSKIKTVDMSKCNSLAVIMNSAFYGCVQLVSVNIPDSVTQLGESVFSGCIRLESASLPEIFVPNTCFTDCAALKSVTVRLSGAGEKIFRTGKLTQGSSSPTASDARLVLRLAAGVDLTLEYSIFSADVNRDGRITAADARRVLRAAAKIEAL